MSRKKPEPKPFYASSNVELELISCEEINRMLARFHWGRKSWEAVLKEAKALSDKRYRGFDIQHELICNSLTRLNVFSPLETAVVWTKPPKDYLFVSELLTLSDVKAFFEEAGQDQLFEEFKEFWHDRKNQIEADARKEREQEYKPVRRRRKRRL